MKDLKLDTNIHELVIENYDLVLIDKLEQVQQNIKIRLLFLYNEWFLDTTKGLPYFDNIMVKNPQLSIIDTIIKSTILETDNVIDLLEYQSSFDNAQRLLTVSFKALTAFGETELEIPL